VAEGRVSRRTLALHGKPTIFNTDQGSQFTSLRFTDVLKKAEIAISMDGRGTWRDNVFVERLWRTIGLPQGLRQCPRGARLDRLLRRLLQWGSPHSGLDRRTPDEAYFNQLQPIPAAAQPRRKSTYPNPGTCSEKPIHLWVS
jgi:putative transposase